MLSKSHSNIGTIHCRGTGKIHLKFFGKLQRQDWKLCSATNSSPQACVCESVFAFVTNIFTSSVHSFAVRRGSFIVIIYVDTLLGKSLSGNKASCTMKGKPAPTRERWKPVNYKSITPL